MFAERHYLFADTAQDPRGDDILDRRELDAFADANLTGANAMSTKSKQTIERWSSEQPRIEDDWVCTPLTVCDPTTEYQGWPKALHLDRECTSLSVCNMALDLYEALPPTATTDRLCAESLPCQVGVEFEANPPTQTTDRACKNFTLCAALEVTRALPMSQC